MHRYLLLLILVWASAAQSKPEPFRVAIFEKVPFGYQEGDQIRGVHVLIAKAIGEKTGRPIEFHLLPIRRAVESLRQGKVDWLIATDSAANADLKTKRAFLMHVMTSVYTLASHKPVSSIQEVDLKMGRIVDGCIELSNRTDIVWNECKTFDQCIDVLLVGRAPSICATDAMKAALAKRKIGPDKIKAYPIAQKSLSVHALPSMPAKKWKEIEVAVEALVKEGKIEQFIADELKP